MNQALIKHPKQFQLNRKNTIYWLFLVLMTLPHLNPAYLQRIPFMDSVLNAWRLFSFLIVIVWMLLKRRISAVSILISVWETFLFVSTLLNNGEVYNAAAGAFSVLSIVYLYDLANKNGKTFFSAQLFCFELVIYAHLITILLFPQGMYSDGSYRYLFTHTKNWFLGYYNGYTIYCIPALMFAWLYKLRTGKRFRPYALMVAVAATAYMMWSGGVLVALSAMVIAYTLFKNRATLFNYYSYWLLHIVYIIAVYVIRLQDIFSWLLDSILGKMKSLLFRIDLIHQTITLIQKSPFLGYGIQSGFVRAAEYHQNHGIHAHNMLMELLYQGGIFGLSLWIAIVVVAGISVYKFRGSEESKIIATAFFGWCIATLVEPFTSSFLMGMFVIAYHSNSDPAAVRQPCRKRINRRIGFS